MIVAHYRADAPSEGAPSVHAEADGLPAALFAGHGPAQLAGLHAINIFLARSAFDLLRSKRFHDPVQRRVQLRLSNITVPNFITPLKLAGLDLGNTVPLIKSAYALPSPSKVLVPRLVMHIVYQGTCTLTIKTSINMKESAAAMAMDKSAEDLDRGLEGGSSSIAAGDAGLEDSTAAHLAGEDLEDALRAEAVGVGEGVYGDAVDACDGKGAAEGMSGKGGKLKRQGGLAMLGYRSIKSIMTGGVKRVMDSIAETVSGTNVTLEVSITELDGPVMIWMAPPPSNILWLSFLEPPKLKVSAKPLNVNAMVHYTAMAVKLTAWLERKIKQALQKNMVFPACTDIKMSFLMDHADLLTENLLHLEIPPQHDKTDSQEKANKSDKGKEAVTDKAMYDRSKSVADSFGASSVAAVAEQACDSAPAAIVFPGDVDDMTLEADTEPQQQQRSPPQAEPTARATRSARPSMDHRPVSAEQTHMGQQGARQAHHMEPARPATPAARGKRPPRSRSDTNLHTGDSSADVADPAGRRPFLRVFTHGIPRMLRRGPQQASPLQTQGPAAAGSRLSGLAAVVSRAGGTPKPSDPKDTPLAHTALLPTLAPDGTATDRLATTAPSGSSAPVYADMAAADGGASAGVSQARMSAQQAALAEGAANIAVPQMQSPTAGGRLTRPHSDADLLELSPQVHVPHPGPSGAAVSSAPTVRSDPCLSTAARELDLSPEAIAAPADPDACASAALGASMVRADACLSTAARELDLSPEAVTADLSAVAPVLAAAPGVHSPEILGGSDATVISPRVSATPSVIAMVDRLESVTAGEPSEWTNNPPARSTPLLKQSSQSSYAANATEADQHLEAGEAARDSGTKGVEASDADASDGAAAASDVRTSDSIATPDSSADEGAAADNPGAASPHADASESWSNMKAAAEVDALGSANAPELQSSTAAAGGVGGSHADIHASGGELLMGPGDMRHLGMTESRVTGGVVGESVRQVQRRSGHGGGDDDTTTCSDDVRSVMSTVGAPSELDVAVPGTPIAPTPGGLQDAPASEVSPTMADMMNQDPAQAALLQLHILGKSKKIKKGSYIISSDGAITRAKKRPS